MLTNIAKDTLYHGYKLRATKFLNHNLQSTIGGVTMSCFVHLKIHLRLKKMTEYKTTEVNIKPVSGSNFQQVGCLIISPFI